MPKYVIVSYKVCHIKINWAQLIFFKDFRELVHKIEQDGNKLVGIKRGNEGKTTQKTKSKRGLCLRSQKKKKYRKISEAESEEQPEDQSEEQPEEKPVQQSDKSESTSEYSESESE